MYGREKPHYESLREFEATYESEKPYHEYWYGEAIQKNSGTALHGALQVVFSLLISRQAWKVACDVRLKLSAYAHPIPDLIADRKQIDSCYPTRPFDLCIEILSPGDDLNRIRQKAAQYLDWGIRSVWIVDPESRKAYIMALGHPSPIELAMTDDFTAGADSEPLFTLQEVFEELDKLLG